MTSQAVIFGPGYVGTRWLQRLEARGWEVRPVTRDGRNGTLAIDDLAGVAAALRAADAILSTVPPDAEGRDPVLERWGETLALAAARWVGYLSSTGVYGDVGGAWVDESAPVTGRRAGRNAADLAWQALRGDMRVFRLPGIYGPGRSALERVAEGKAHLVDMPGQVFSRIHVEDLVAALLASLRCEASGVFNIADDLPASQNDVMYGAARMLGAPPPSYVTLADLSPAARAFYGENRRVANGRAKRLLGWTPRYPTWVEGLAACRR